MFYDELRRDFWGRKNFLMIIYYVILDNLNTELIKRKKLCDNLTSKYSSFLSLTT